MVQRVTVSPSEVRGYGDIVSPKTTEDFYEYMCSVTESDGVYTMVYDDTATYLTLSASPTTITYGESTVLTATLTVEGEKASGETVYFYEGETLLGSDTTDSNGEATLTKSDFSIGSHSVKAVYDEVESNAVSVSVTKLAVTVSLSADSSSITYGSNVVLSGVLSLGSGVTVTIYDGTTSLGTVTTGTGGAFSKTVTTPSVGSHSFKVEYAGDTTHDSATASTSVTVNKLTSTITLSVPASGTVGTSYTVSGTLVPTTGSVKLYENGSLKDTLTVSSGSFSKAITQNSEGTYSYYAVFEGSSTYESVTSSTGSIVVSDVPAPVPASIDLTGTKSILSYADSESCVLTATVLDSSDNPVEGVTVNLYNGSTLWDTLTTDSSGECSKTYSSAGVGDITFTAEVDGTLLTKTYVVEDCTYYNPSTVTTTTTVSISLPTDVEVSFKVKRTSSSNNYSYIEIGGNSGNTALMGQVGGAGVSQFRTYVSEGSSTIDTTHDTSNVPSNTETLLVWTKNGTSQSYSTADSKVTWTDSHTHSKIRKLTISNNRIQELKVKPL